MTPCGVEKNRSFVSSTSGSTANILPSKHYRGKLPTERDVPEIDGRVACVETVFGIRGDAEEIAGSSKLLVQTLQQLIPGKIMRNIDINGGHDLCVLLVNTPQPLP